MNSGAEFNVHELMAQDNLNEEVQKLLAEKNYGVDTF
jgi:hypothetical protein